MATLNRNCVLEETCRRGGRGWEEVKKENLQKLWRQQLIKEGKKKVDLKKKTTTNFHHLQTCLPTVVTLVCRVVFSRAGPAASPMATLPVFIIGLLPLSCQHSQRRFPRGIVLWDARELRRLRLLSSVARTPPLCHVACIALSSGSPAADLHINHAGWRSKYLQGSISRCLPVLTHNVTSFNPFFLNYILPYFIVLTKLLWEKDGAAFHSCLVNARIHQQNDGIAQQGCVHICAASAQSCTGNTKAAVVNPIGRESPNWIAFLFMIKHCADD